MWYRLIQLFSVRLKPEDRATVDQLLNHKIILRTKKIDKMVFLQWLNQVT